jgi:hypothetical protein
MQCQNTFENCPLEYDIEGSWVTGPATTAILQASPEIISVNSPFSVTVTLYDANGNVHVYANNNIVLSMTSGTGSLIGTTLGAPSQGVATFSDISITEAGAHVLTATYNNINGTVTVDIQNGAAPKPAPVPANHSNKILTKIYVFYILLVMVTIML